jgi:transposase
MFVLTTGCRWRDLPAQMGRGSGVTCWRRLRDWQQAGGLDPTTPSGPGPARPAGPDRLVPALRGQREPAGENGGDLVGPNAVDRGKPGSRYHLLVDADGIPLAAHVSAANTHDSKLFEPLLDAAPAIKGRGRGRPRRRPGKLHADKGYDIPHCRVHLRRRGITARIARRGVESKERLGRHRWVVERTVSWILRYQRLGLRYDRSELTMTAPLTFACAHSCFKILTRRTAF